MGEVQGVGGERVRGEVGRVVCLKVICVTDCCLACLTLMLSISHSLYLPSPLSSISSLFHCFLLSPTPPPSSPSPSLSRSPLQAMSEALEAAMAEGEQQASA